MAGEELAQRWRAVDRRVGDGALVGHHQRQGEGAIHIGKPIKNQIGARPDMKGMAIKGGPAVVGRQGDFAVAVAEKLLKIIKSFQIVVQIQNNNQTAEQANQ